MTKELNIEVQAVQMKSFYSVYCVHCVFEDFLIQMYEELI